MAWTLSRDTPVRAAPHENIEKGVTCISAALNRRNRILKVIVMVGAIGGAFAAGRAFAAQPHMEAALNALLTAQSELKVAEHNKGGHRAKALDLVNRTIEQVHLGIAAGG